MEKSIEDIIIELLQQDAIGKAVHTSHEALNKKSCCTIKFKTKNFEFDRDEANE